MWVWRTLENRDGVEVTTVPNICSTFKRGWRHEETRTWKYFLLHNDWILWVDWLLKFVTELLSTFSCQRPASLTPAAASASPSRSRPGWTAGPDRRAGPPVRTSALRANVLQRLDKQSCCATFVSLTSCDLLSSMEKPLSIVCWTLCCSSTLKPAKEKSSNV